MSICDLKVSSMDWYIIFHSVVISNGYVVIDEYHYDYTKRSKDNFVVKLLYVDDLLIAKNGVELLSKAKDIVII